MTTNYLYYGLITINLICVQLYAWFENVADTPSIPISLFIATIFLFMLLKKQIETERNNFMALIYGPTISLLIPALSGFFIGFSALIKVDHNTSSFLDIIKGIVAGSFLLSIIAIISSLFLIGFLSVINTLGFFVYRKEFLRQASFNNDNTKLKS
ncbi:hypothetical protein [Desulfovibrio litoralis]|uniref:Uncharacterized protein n=1 Tax=Desulfovibrio litoralis DSM 11393 TaxID=1121455 RepID=A0A1M7RY51_9BACT|nr:hypothetical protein [Desulfovibrio litoralis]SHN51088.1 hypothetical protein SAMN02745728_00317 [Desulfovibrio litoralis DSM 11393]